MRALWGRLFLAEKVSFLIILWLAAVLTLLSATAPGRKANICKRCGRNHAMEKR